MSNSITTIEARLLDLVVDRAEKQQQFGEWWPERDGIDEEIYHLRKELTALETEESSAEVEALRSKYRGAADLLDSTVGDLKRAEDAAATAKKTLVAVRERRAAALRTRQTVAGKLRAMGLSIGAPVSALASD